MKISSFTYADEADVLAGLQPHLQRKLNPCRMSEWIANRRVSADQPVPMVVRQSGGVYRRFLKVRGMPDFNERPRFSTDVDIHNQRRGILPIAGFEYDYPFRKPSDPCISITPGGNREMFLIAGTYDCEPGSNDPAFFYPKIVRSGRGLGHASQWEPFFIDPNQAERWLEPWHDPDFDFTGRPFRFFQFDEAGIQTNS